MNLLKKLYTLLIHGNNKFILVNKQKNYFNSLMLQQFMAINKKTRNSYKKNKYKLSKYI